MDKMIEIRITVDAASNLLLDRMKQELKMRQVNGLILRGLSLENLKYSELISITEASIFDTVFLLPVEIIRTENNLAQVVSEAVRALSKVLRHEEFELYTTNQANKMILLIRNYFETNLSVNTPGEN
jgi:hypothetical protein